MSAPLIGISLAVNGERDREFKPGYVLDFQTESYSRYVAHYGGIPVLLPNRALDYLSDLLPRLDGLVLSGGADLELPAASEGTLGRSAADPEQARRTRFEHEALHAALQRRLPVLGICRGLQQINVSLGGSLWQDLEEDLGIQGHDRPDAPWSGVHRVRLEEDCSLGEGLPRCFAVNSTHHQAVRDLGRDLCVVARQEDEDRVVEALRLQDEGRWLRAVQWHPERMHEDLPSQVLMEEFLQACGGPRA